jgi:UDP-N-acetylglucosamine 1-carboxyvinyltransferase
LNSGDRYQVIGGQPLAGEVPISGAKNAALPILAATLLSPAEMVIHATPEIRDIGVMIAILRRLGVAVDVLDGSERGRSLRIRADGLMTPELSADFTREMRSSIFLMGPLLARTGLVRISYPGGCAIGPRPIDFHLRGLQQMGALIREEHGFIEAEAPGGLVGTELYLDFPSVGATENLMMAAVLAKGTTLIRNAAREPEILDLAEFCNKLGARIQGAGDDVIQIEGVEALPALTGVEHAVIPDRIEAATYLCAAAITGGDLTLIGVRPNHVVSICAKLGEMGAQIQTAGDQIRIRGPKRPRAADVKTLPYPGFPTDAQPQLMAVLSLANGTSIITETVFENRLQVAEELKRLGAQVRTEGRTAVIKGVKRLTGATVLCPALREGMALVLAGLAAEGQTVIDGILHIDRGYHQLEQKLRAVGAQIERI